MHDFAGIPAIGLQKHVLGVRATTNARSVVEQPLAPALDQIHLRISGRCVGEIPVVGRYIPVRRSGYGKDNGLMGVFHLLLDGRQVLIGKFVKAA